MFQLRLLNQMGARRQRRSPTLFSSLADALRTAGTAYASGQITQGAQDRREAANADFMRAITPRAPDYGAGETPEVAQLLNSDWRREVLDRHSPMINAAREGTGTPPLDAGYQPGAQQYMGAMLNPDIGAGQRQMAEMLYKNSLPKPKEDFTLAANAIRVGADGEVIASNLIENKLGEFEKIVLTQYEEGSPGYNQAMRDWVKKNVNINKGPLVQIDQGQSEHDKAMGKIFAERFKLISEEANIARQQIDALGGQKQLFMNASGENNFYTGAGGGLVNSAKKLLVALGAPKEIANSVANAEGFSAASKNVALALIGGSLGVGFSNADRSFIEEQVPTLQNTPAGNRVLIHTMLKAAKHRIKVAKEASRYAKENNGLGYGWDEHIAQWAEKNPVFPITPKTNTQKQDQDLEEILSGLGD